MSLGKNNIISVSWGDHLTAGKGDGLLTTVELLRKRMKIWRDELGVTALQWRHQRDQHTEGVFTAAPGADMTDQIKSQLQIEWDDFTVVPRIAHELGLKSFVYATIYDEGRPLMSEKEREVSYHNKGHGQHRAWQSHITIENPEYLLTDRALQKRHWGVMSMAYPEVRNHLLERLLKLINGYEFDGLFICFRSQSRPPDFADEFGFNQPIRDEFLSRYGQDIWVDEFDKGLWRDLQGEYLSQFVESVSEGVRSLGKEFSIGCARGDVLGHPLGNVSLQWRDWVNKRVVDQLVINQNSAVCPSMWIDLWPMHRGGGYIQDYTSGEGMQQLGEQLTNEYLPVIKGKSTELYVARQWSNPDVEEEARISGHDAVSGIVYSSFRYDNSHLIAEHEGDWVF